MFQKHKYLLWRISIIIYVESFLQAIWFGFDLTHFMRTCFVPMHIVTKNHICGTYWLVGGCWWWFVVILVVFGDFSVFSVIFVVHICHICCHICIIFVILFYGTSAISMCHKNFFDVPRKLPMCHEKVWANCSVYSPIC